jgi:hypothetical protein
MAIKIQKAFPVSLSFDMKPDLVYIYCMSRTNFFQNLLSIWFKEDSSRIVLLVVIKMYQFIFYPHPPL